MEALELARPGEGALDVVAASSRLAGAEPEEIVGWAAETFGERLVMTSSFGSHSAVMLHLVSRVLPKIPVIFLDTGYLFPETYRFAEALRRRLDLRLEVYAPRITAARQEALHGRLYDGDEDALRRYQEIHKVEPLRRALRELDARAWLAGLRRDQTAFRARLGRVEAQDGVYKIHPILDWSRGRVERYLDRHDLPLHPLHAYGYRSIGDAHSTVPVDPGEVDDRAGRRLGEARECGIHLPRGREADASRKSSGL